jgi:glycosyltransferase involved in cell wall biosynthesis
MTVSVILPIYKVEPYIERCVRSLMEQSYDDIEFLFVDDASPDESVSIAKRTVAEYNRNVVFLAHQTNKGLPGARNTGLSAATGEYVYQCDSDDWLEPDMIEKMVKSAIDNDSDFVYCDFFLSFAEKERYMAQPHFSDKYDALQKGVMTGAMKHNVWNKLIKRRLYTDNGIKSPEEHCKGGEDFMIIKLLRMAGHISHVPEALYHYNRANFNAITRTGSERRFDDIKANADDVISFLESNPIEDPVYINYFKLNVKLPFLMDRNRKQFERWRQWYPEADSFIMENREISFRTRIVELAAKIGAYPLVWLYASAVEFFYKLHYQ